MSNDLSIGGMHGELGIDVRGWFDGFEDAREVLADFAKEVMSQFKELEGNIRNFGLGLSAAITVPFAGMTVATKRGAGEFEKSMNNVHAALRGISGEQLQELSDTARKLGPEVGRSATEAADGIETLGLAGMGASDILNGGLAQTLRLAAANAADLGQSAAVVTDVMAQFGKSSGDLEGVVNKITGALDASKLGFNDFKDAIAQGGGVAGAAGVSFEDFNTSLAGTAALFGSGSDAGTSFKTFISTLTPQSKEAAEMMEKLGLDFYDTTGRMKGMADIAEMLREKLGNLSDRSRTNVLTTIFGSDAMRTAIGLMRLGGQEFENLQKTIGETDAGEKLAIQLQGVEASANNLGNAFDELKIALGETGILAAFTAFQNGLASIVRTLAELPLWLRTIVVGIWGVSAAIGPMILALMGIAKVVAPLMLMTGAFGTLGTILGALINPVGAIIALLGRLIFAISGTSAALATLGYTMAIWAGGIGLAVTAITLLVLWLNRKVVADDAATRASANAAEGLRKQQDLTLQLVSATGQLRKALLDKANADRRAALDAMFKAKQDVEAGKAALQRAKAELQASKGQVKITARGDVISPKVSGNLKAVEQAEANLLTYAKTLNDRAETVEGYTRAINTPELATVDLDLDKDAAAKGRKGSGPSAAELADRREMMKIEQQIAVARARDDKDAERSLQDQLDIIQRRRDYEDAGLSNALAQKAAERDIADIKKAEAEFNAREIERGEAAFDLRLAEIRGDEAMVRLKEDQAFLDERTAYWQDKKLTLKEAEKRATEDLVQLDAARAAALARQAQQDALDRTAELSRARGDTAALQRETARAAELERRMRQYIRDGQGKVSEDDARDRASRELDEEERARQQGRWRDTFKGAMRAAMDGDLKGFVSNWWKDQMSRGMEEAINSLSDMLFNLFRQALGQGGAASGGGLFGGVGSALAGLFGGGSSLGGVSAGSLSYLDGVAAQLAVPKNLPGFATGGSFEIGGAPGIDTNLVQFWGTAGETVNVRRANDNEGGGVAMIVPSPYFDVVVDRRAASVAAPMSVQAATGASVGAQRATAKRASRRLG